MGGGGLRKVYNIKDCMAKWRENKWEKGRAGEARKEAGKGEGGGEDKNQSRGQ